MPRSRSTGSAQAIAIDPAPAEPWANLAQALGGDRPPRGGRQRAEAKRPSGRRSIRRSGATSRRPSARSGATRARRRRRRASAMARSIRVHAARVVQPRARARAAGPGPGSARRRVAGPRRIAPDDIRARRAFSRSCTSGPRPARPPPEGRSTRALAQRATADRAARAARAACAERVGELAGAAGRAGQRRAARRRRRRGAVAARVPAQAPVADWHDLRGAAARGSAPGSPAGRPWLTPFALLVRAVDARASSARCAERWSARSPAPPAARPIVRRPCRPAAHRLPVGRLPRARDRVPHRGPVRAARPRPLRGRRAIRSGPTTAARCARALAAAFDRFVDARRRPPERSAARDPRRRHRRAGRPQGPHGAGADRRPRAAPGAGPGALPRLPGHDRRACVDYLIGDADRHARASTRRTTPRRWCELPGSYQVNDRAAADRRRPRARGARPAGGRVVLCCFNSDLEAAAPRSSTRGRAILARACRTRALAARARRRTTRRSRNLRREAAARGIDAGAAGLRRAPAECRSTSGSTRTPTWSSTPGRTTRTPPASDALWAGCPVLTLAGRDLRRPRRREPARAVGLPELVAGDVDDYVEKAMALARDAPRCAACARTSKGPGRASPLFDAARDHARARGGVRRDGRRRRAGGGRRADPHRQAGRAAVSRAGVASASSTRLDGDDLNAVNGLLRLVDARDEELAEAQLGRFLIRSWPRWTGRISPASPTSPKTSVFAGNGRLRQRRIDGQQDREVRRRLVDAHAAHRVDEDVVAGRLDAAVAVQHGEQQREPLRIEAHGQPLRHRRPAPGRPAPGSRPAAAASPRAWRRSPSPGTDSACCDRNSADGLATPFRPRSVIANTPSSLAAPKRFLIARTRRKLECVSPSK